MSRVQWGWSQVAKGKPPSWRVGHTISAVSLLMLGCGAAIALSGVLHQTVWLMSDPWTENRGKRMEQTLPKRNTQDDSLTRNLIQDVQALANPRCGSFEIFQLSRIRIFSPSTNCPVVILDPLTLLASPGPPATFIGVNSAS